MSYSLRFFFSARKNVKNSQIASYHNIRRSLSLCHIKWGKKFHFSAERFFPPNDRKVSAFLCQTLKIAFFIVLLGCEHTKSMSNFPFFSFSLFLLATENFLNAPFCRWKLFWALLSILMHVLRNVACIQLNLAAWIFPCVFGKAERKIKTRRENFFFGSAIHQFLLWPSCISSIVKRTRTERSTHHQVALTQRKCCENLCILLPSRFVFHLLGNLE